MPLRFSISGQGAVSPLPLFRLQREVAHLFHHLLQGLAGDVLGLGGVVLVALLQVGLVGDELLVPLLDGPQLLDDGLGHGGLEIAVALALELLFRLRGALARKGCVDGEQVGNARFFLGRVADYAVAVRHRALEFADDRVLIVGHGDEPVGVFVRLAHLTRRVCKAHDARAAALGDIAVGDGERRTVAVVKADGEVARKL